jgi:hypothetical protein
MQVAGRGDYPVLDTTRCMEYTFAGGTAVAVNRAGCYIRACVVCNLSGYRVVLGVGITRKVLSSAPTKHAGSVR